MSASKGRTHRPSWAKAKEDDGDGNSSQNHDEFMVISRSDSQVDDVSILSDDKSTSAVANLKQIMFNKTQPATIEESSSVNPQPQSSSAHSRSSLRSRSSKVSDRIQGFQDNFASPKTTTQSGNTTPSQQRSSTVFSSPFHNHASSTNYNNSSNIINFIPPLTRQDTEKSEGDVSNLSNNSSTTTNTATMVVKLQKRLTSSQQKQREQVEKHRREKLNWQAATVELSRIKKDYTRLLEDQASQRRALVEAKELSDSKEQSLRGIRHLLQEEAAAVGVCEGAKTALELKSQIEFLLNENKQLDLEKKILGNSAVQKEDEYLEQIVVKVLTTSNGLQDLLLYQNTTQNEIKPLIAQSNIRFQEFQAECLPNSTTVQNQIQRMQQMYLEEIETLHYLFQQCQTQQEENKKLTVELKEMQAQVKDWKDLNEQDAEGAAHLMTKLQSQIDVLTESMATSTKEWLDERKILIQTNQSQAEAMEQTFQKQQQELGTLSQEKEKWQASIANNQQEAQQAKSQLEEQEQTTKQLRKTIVSLEEQIRLLQEDHEAKETELEQLRAMCANTSECDDLKTQLEESNRQVSEFTDRNEECFNQIVVLQDRIASLEKEKQQHASEQEELVTEIEQYETESKQTKNRFANLKTTMGMEITGLESTVSNLQATNQNLHDEQSQWTIQKEEFTNQVQDQLESIEKLKAELGQSKTNKESIEGAIKQLSEDLEHSTEVMANQKEEIEGLKGSNSNLEEVAKTLTEKKELAINKMEEGLEYLADLQAKTHALERENEESVLEKEAFTSRAKESQEAIEQLKSQVSELKNAAAAEFRVETIEQELAALRQKFAAESEEKEKEVSKQKAEIKALESKNETLEQEQKQSTKSYKKRMSALEKEKEELLRDSESLQNRDRIQQKTVEHLETELTSAQQQIESLGKKCEELQECHGKESEVSSIQTRALEETIQGLEKKIVSLEAENKTIWETSEQQKLDLESTMTSVLEKTKVESAARAEVELVKQERNELKSRHAEENENAEQAIKNLQERINSFEDGIESKNRVNELEEEINRVCDEKEHLLTLVHQLKGDVLVLEVRLKEEKQTESEDGHTSRNQTSMEETKSHRESKEVKGMVKEESDRAIGKVMEFHRTIAQLRNENENLEAQKQGCFASEEEMMIRNSNLMKSLKGLEENFEGYKHLAEKREQIFREEIGRQIVSFDSLFEDLSSSRKEVEILQHEIAKLDSGDHKTDQNDVSEPEGLVSRPTGQSQMIRRAESSEQSEYLQPAMTKKQENGWTLRGGFLKSTSASEDESSSLKEEIVTLRSNLVKLQTQYKEESYKNRKIIQELQLENEAILLKNAVLTETYGESLRS